MTPAIFTIPAHVGFVDALAAGLLDRAGTDPLALARATVLLPNRRAVRALTDAFVRASGSGLLLPRLVPVAEADASVGGFGGPEATPPPMDATKRRLLLAQLVRRWHPVPAVEALRLADQLAAALDAMIGEDVPAAALKDIVPGELAHHWEKTFAFLRLVVDLWPPVLAAHGEVDAGAARRDRLDALAARWREVPPAGMIVAAGIASAPPPVARLLHTVARLPRGLVVLPGLDLGMVEDAWAAIRCRRTDPDLSGPESEEHPQFTLKCLLDAIGVARGEVAEWPYAGRADGPPNRAAIVAEAMAPAAFTGGWRHAVVDRAPFAGVRTLVAATAEEEAQAIALALRRTLDTPGATAALVTPDRGLARRVAAHCRRWGIAIDDSAGTPLAVTPPGALFQALVEAAARGFGAVPLLALAKHPLVNAGERRSDWLRAVRRLDRTLRGVRPAPGLDGIAARIDEAIAERAEAGRETAAHEALAAWWHDTAALLDPLERRFARPAVAFTDLVADLAAAATALCGDGAWAGVDGRALARVVGDLTAHGHHLDPFDPADAPALVAAFLTEAAVRPAFGTHPRLAIYGLLEARLQRADLTILGGLNEGVWPGRPVPDPWLAPRLRRDLGLPSLERRIGLAAHDFVAAMGGPAVLLTRARRDDTAPTVASRFWLRLHARAGDVLVHDDALLATARGLDAAGVVSPAARPAPAPPAADRPRTISVTAAERLKTDPFAYYAAAMLKLRPLDPLDEDASAADRGTAVHRILEAWIKDGDAATLPAHTEAELLRWSGHPLMRALWAPRVRRAMDWVAETMAAWEAAGWSPLAAEAAGYLDLPTGIRLTGKADRIDRGPRGELAIIDYKTGTPPSHDQVTGGFALQLGLLAKLAEAGRLGGVAPATVAALRYWKLGGGKTAGVVRDPLSHNREGTPPAEHIAAVLTHFDRLCSERLLGDAPFVAKLHPDYAKGDEYDQLARVREWQGRG
ncbi:MAG: double-strand break repair protein AddB [Sphingomonadaceae bacterium]|nr:double-strand break repair protein AddB [Sphingomonadaceae bacterium]